MVWVDPVAQKIAIAPQIDDDERAARAERAIRARNAYSTQWRDMSTVRQRRKLPVIWWA